MDDSDYMRRKIAGESADLEAGSLARRSKLERLHPEKVRFDLTWEDIKLEQPIGYGGFSQVFQVRIRTGGNPASLDEVEQEQQQQQHEHELSEKQSRSYALKCLNPQTKLHTKSFKTGAVDLAIEGEILSRLEHENVIQLHGICGGTCSEAYLNSDRGYFIVLDLLTDTLASKLEKYRATYKSHSSSIGMGGMHGGGTMMSHGTSSSRKSSHSSSSSSTAKHMRQSAVLERVSSVAMGVAKGMEYLHSQGVALRDLKPDNIGFDQDGVPKIFDLGFAREVHTIKRSEVAGSLRYMAPEVARGEGSELASDVYSFGVLLWEICTLDKPYKHITSRDDFMQTVVDEEWRHTTAKIPSSSLRKLIKECWQTDASKRPTFNQLVKKLRVELSLSKTNTSTTSSSATPNKGFGSSINLKRTATWTAKKLSNGISQSNLGVLRLGFKSSNSLTKSSDSLTETTTTTTTTSTMNSSTNRRRSRSPKPNARFAPMSSNGIANSPFTGFAVGQPMFPLSSSSSSSLQVQTMTIVEGSEPPAKSEKPASQSQIRRSLPSCPQITSTQY